MKIMFVCHGNICRSPMAEFIMKDLLEKSHISHLHTALSSAVSTEEIGNPVYPGARKELAKHGISCNGKYAVQLKREDYDKYDLFLLMDHSNMMYLCRIFPDDPLHKVHLLLDFAGKPGEDISDPWYTGHFDKAYADILSGCKGLLEFISQEN